jgi:hypothetical protein
MTVLQQNSDAVPAGTTMQQEDPSNTSRDTGGKYIGSHAKDL